MLLGLCVSLFLFFSLFSFFSLSRNKDKTADLPIFPSSLVVNANGWVRPLSFFSLFPFSLSCYVLSFLLFHFPFLSFRFFPCPILSFPFLSCPSYTWIFSLIHSLTHFSFIYCTYLLFHPISFRFPFITLSFPSRSSAYLPSFDLMWRHLPFSHSHPSPTTTTTTTNDVDRWSAE